MAVVHDDHQRRFLRNRLEELAHAPERLLGTRGRSADCGRGERALSNERCLRPIREQRSDPGARLFEGVGLGDPGRVANDLEHRPEADAFPVRETASAEHPRAVEVRCELVRQPGLAEPCSAEDGHEPRLRRGEHRVELRAKLRQLVVPADQRRVQSPGVAGGPKVDVDEPIGRHAVGLPFQGQQFDRLDMHGVADQPEGLLADQDFTAGRRLLEPCRDVHRVAGRKGLA